MSPCTRYPNHLSHGNSFSNREQNPPFFATWWSFLLFCLLRSCRKLQRRFKMLPLKGTPAKINRPERQLSLSSADTTFCPSGSSSFWSHCEVSSRLPRQRGGLAQHVRASSAPTVPQLVTQCCKWASIVRGPPFSGSQKTSSGGSSCLVMRAGCF